VREVDPGEHGPCRDGDTAKERRRSIGSGSGRLGHGRRSHVAPVASRRLHCREPARRADQVESWVHDRIMRQRNRSRLDLSQWSTGRSGLQAGTAGRHRRPGRRIGRGDQRPEDAAGRSGRSVAPDRDDSGLAVRSAASIFDLTRRAAKAARRVWVLPDLTWAPNSYRHSQMSGSAVATTVN
jgi:hypothetical protein